MALWCRDFPTVSVPQGAEPKSFTLILPYYQQSLAAATTERERLTQEVERLKAAEFYTQYARAEKAEAQRDAAHEALREYQDAYVKAVEANTYSNGEMKHRDHACAECGPVVEGWESRKFVCRYHKAKAALQSVPNQQGHVSEQVLDPTGMFPIKRVPKETK